MLFTATVPARILKEAISCAKPISGALHLSLDPNDADPVGFWSVDANRLFSVEGRVLGRVTTDVQGDEPTVVQIASVLLEGCIKQFNTKKPIVLTLEEGEDESLVLGFHQDTGDETDRRQVSVEISEEPAVEKTIPTGAFASVDLEQFSKVLTSFRRNTDIVTLAIEPDLFRASLATKHLADGWEHPAATRGKGKGLFAVRSLQTVISAASKVDRAGDLFVVEGHPLQVEVASDSLRARYYIAERESMR